MHVEINRGIYCWKNGKLTLYQTFIKLCRVRHHFLLVPCVLHQRQYLDKQNQLCLDVAKTEHEYKLNFDTGVLSLYKRYAERGEKGKEYVFSSLFQPISHNIRGLLLGMVHG